MRSQASWLPDLDSLIKLHWNANQSQFLPQPIAPKLRKTAEKVAALTGSWNPVDFLTPSPENIKRERQTFFEHFDRNQEYNPVFVYDAAEGIDFETAREKLQAFLKDVKTYSPQNKLERFFRLQLYAKIRDDLATCKLLEGLHEGSEAKIRSGLERKYPKSDLILLAYAKRAYSDLVSQRAPAHQTHEELLLTPTQQRIVKKAQFDAQDIQEAFEWTLKKYGMLRSKKNPHGFSVAISDQVTGIDVRDKADEPMTIYIPIDRVASGDELLSLIAHEIEGHARQSMNGLQLFGIGGGALKLDDETLYEGLAKRLDESFHKRFFGVDLGIPVPWFTLAVHRAEQGATFYEVFLDQYKRQLRAQLHIPLSEKLLIDEKKHAKEIENVRELSWVITYRVMRGHVDMTNPLGFAMCKDLGYLRGWLMDKQLREIGQGGINEMAVMQTGGLQLLARVGAVETDMPYPYKDFTKEYCFSVLLPLLTK